MPVWLSPPKGTLMPDRQENELLDPYTSIVDEMEIKQDDAAYMASFVDSEKIVAALKKAQYNVGRKVEILTNIIAGEDSSISEQLRAMKIIDEMLASSLAARGIQVRPVAMSGVTNPLGQPQAIHSVEMIEKSVKMTMANTEALTEIKDQPQPLKELIDGKKEENDDDAFFEDHRGTTGNVFRPATGELNAS
jgi:hypothetical protein